MLEIDIGIIKGVERKKNRDGEHFVRMLTCEISDDQDNQQVELINPAGEDSVPELEDTILIISLGSGNKYGFTMDSDRDVSINVEKGERLFFSRDGVDIKAQLFLNKLGEIVLNQGADFAVAFDKLKTKIDLLDTRLVAHTHIGVAAGGQTSGPSGLAQYINIDDAKVEKVRL